MHEVLVNRLGGLSLPRKSVVRLTDRPDMTSDVYRGRKATMQQQQQQQKMVKKKIFCHCNTMNVDIIHKCCAYATDQNFFLKIIGASYVVTYATFSRLPSENHTFHSCHCTSAV